MKTKMRIPALLLIVLLLVSMLQPTPVLAAENVKITKSDRINSDFYFWGGNTIVYTFRYADGSQVTTNLGGFAVHYAGANLTSIVGSQVAYCIEPNTGSTSGTYYTGTSAENNSYWQNKLSWQQRDAIRLIMLYGAPNNLKSTNNSELFGYEGATQLLIWEIIMGLRSPSYPYTLNDARLKNNFWSNSSSAPTKVKKLMEGYNTIVQRMQSHLTIPSFAGKYASTAPTYTLNYDSGSGLYTCELTDTNGVLAQDYNFSAPGVTMTKSGNTLYISAPASALAGGNVTASAIGHSLDMDSLTQMIWTAGAGNQTLSTFSASPDPAPCYFKLQLGSGTATMRKTSDTGDVNGYCFKIYKQSDHTAWYGKSDSSGNVYETDSGYSSSIGNQTFSGLTDGTYTFLEALSQKGKDSVFPDSWRITVTREGATQYDHTFTASDFIRDANGDCRLANVEITGLTGGGVMTMTIHNAPDGGSATLRKTSDTSDVKDYCFKLYKHSDHSTWYGKSDNSGNVYETNSSYTAGGTLNYTFSDLTDGTYTFLEVLSQKGKDVVFPDSWTITVTRGGVTQYNRTFTKSDFTKDANGDCRLANVAITGLTGRGVMSMTIHNAPEEDELEIIKTSTDGEVGGISFRIEEYSGEWFPMTGTYVTSDIGKIVVPGLSVGTRLRITEIVPDGYTCTSQNPQEITISRGTNTVNFSNSPIPAPLEIVKTSTDGEVSGISFKVEKFESGGVGWWTSGTYVTNASGKINLTGLHVGEQLRVTEIVPENYVCTSQNPQEITLTSGTNRLSFTNIPTVSLEIVKTSDDGNVSGISFLVEQQSGSSYGLLGVYETDSQGKINIPDLLVDTRYRITETVPANYVCENRIQTVTTVAGKNTVTFVNHPTASLEILKLSDDDIVSGISFRVERWNGSGYSLVDHYTTGINGKINISNLEVGTRYRITEVVPDYYTPEVQTQVITTTAGKNTVTFVNHPFSSIEIVKTSEDGNVGGISFLAEQWNGSIFVLLGVYETDVNGKINIPNLQWNNRYRFTETVPANYVNDNRIQTITTVTGKNTVTFVNHPTSSIEIVKTSDDGNVSGISFLAEQWNGSGFVLLGVYETDVNGKINIPNLQWNTKYRITETVLDSYVCENSVQEITTVLGKNTVRFYNRLTRGSLKLFKADKATRTPLEGAVFRVYNGSGSMVAEQTTDENGEAEFLNLPYGNYTYQEVTAPDGFALDDTRYSFSVLEDGAVIEVTCENQPQQGSIHIYKTDEKGRPLSGVEFLLEYSTDGGSTWAPVQSRSEDDPVQAGYCTSSGLTNGRLLTDRSGVATFTGLCIDTQLGVVRYRLTETATRNGYSLLAGYAFEGSLSTDSEQEVELHVVNSPSYEMPMTGGAGFTVLSAVMWITAAAYAAVTAALLLMLARRKSRK